jgi:hypothetical protein
MRGRDCIYAVTNSATGETVCYEPTRIRLPDDDDDTYDDWRYCTPDADACEKAVARHGQHVHE